MTCNHEGTITDVLMRTEAFKELAKKNDKKELIILKEGRAISAHFPCSLINDNNEPLIIKYTNRKNEEEVKEEKESKADTSSIENQSGKVIVFHLCTSWEKNKKMILKNQEIKSVCDEITVYAYEGETVEDALQRDGRLCDAVFEKNCGLIQEDTEVKLEFFNVVDNVMKNKCFKIYLKPTSKRKRPLEGDSIGEAATANEGDQDPSQLSPTTETGYDRTSKKKPKKNEALMKSEHHSPILEEVVCVLRQQFDDAMEAINNGVKGPNLFSHLQECLRVEYAKNDEACREVRVMKKLMKLSDSVCIVAIKSRRFGSGFLLFDRFVLTNCHVVEDVLNETGPLQDNVTVFFLNEEFNSQSLKGVKVEEVVAFRYFTDQSGHSYDWALLKLVETADISCSCLLEHFGYLPPSGGLCIIGHPDCGVKKIDPCFIIPATDYRKTVEKHCAENSEGGVRNPNYGAEGPIQWVGHHFFEDVSNEITGKKNIVGYNTRFYFGSSGSPVFDNNCKVVALHSGGYPYHNEKNESQSVIDYGYLLSYIIEDMIIKLVEMKKFDVLSKYLSVDYNEKQNIRDGVKKLTESRGFTGFNDALKTGEVSNNEDLKDFFDFICQKDKLGMEV